MAVPSVMSDPKYQYEEYFQVMDQYYEKYPEKYPDVVAVYGYQGEIDYELRAAQPLMDWLENDFKATRTEEGVFWIYYFRD